MLARNLIRSLQLLLSKLNIGLISYRTLLKYEKNSSSVNDLEFLKRLRGTHSENLLRYLEFSKSQLRQDLFVLSQTNFKRDGFFVEFGATNGLDFSNTYLLEKEFGWRGILAEPAQIWHPHLFAYRNCHIETACVWAESNKTIRFNQVQVPELSTISSFSFSDNHASARKHGTSYEVQTISLTDLLERYSAPNKIDYLSIDTEGSEYDILKNFDFTKYEFEVITCEHNYTPKRKQIQVLLEKNGYRRVFEDLSKFDDWYVKDRPKDHTAS